MLFRWRTIQWLQQILPRIRLHRPCDRWCLLCQWKCNHTRESDCSLVSGQFFGEGVQYPDDVSCESDSSCPEDLDGNGEVGTLLRAFVHW